MLVTVVGKGPLFLPVGEYDHFVAVAIFSLLWNNPCREKWECK